MTAVVQPDVVHTKRKHILKGNQAHTHQHCGTSIFLTILNFRNRFEPSVTPATKMGRKGSFANI